MLPQLIEYARAKGLVVEPGFKPKKVRFVLLFDKDGHYQRVHDYLKDARVLPNAPDLSSSELKRLGQGKTCHYLVESIGVITLFKLRPADKKSIHKHQFFIDLLRQSASILPSLVALADALSSNDILSGLAQ